MERNEFREAKLFVSSPLSGSTGLSIGLWTTQAANPCFSSKPLAGLALHGLVSEEQCQGFAIQFFFLCTHLKRNKWLCRSLCPHPKGWRGGIGAALCSFILLHGCVKLRSGSTSVLPVFEKRRKGAELDWWEWSRIGVATHSTCTTHRMHSHFVQHKAYLARGKENSIR